MVLPAKLTEVTTTSELLLEVPRRRPVEPTLLPSSPQPYLYE